ncbi:MAG: hypothetical protein RXR32_01925 [Candidatus Micrarchaeota archaeon]
MEREVGGVDKSGCSGKIAEAIASKRCVADDKIYDTKSAEEKDLAYIAENTCMVCGRRFRPGELKIVPPQSVQEEDIYVMHGIVPRRYICTNCYEDMTSNTREKIKSEYITRTDETENKLIRTLVRGMLKPKALKL